MPTPRSALITGITGQDGSYLAELLLAKGYRVVGMVRAPFGADHPRIAHLRERVELVPGDLADLASLVDAIRAAAPDEVYNLAGQSLVHTSWPQTELTGQVTALGAMRLLEAVRTVDPTIRVYQAGSSEMFGKPVESPQSETTPFRPRSPYGMAKLFGHFAALNYREGHGMHVVSGILFNHESPRRGLEFVTRKITDAVARIRLGLERELRLGNLEARRDWGFAGDYVEAIHRMLQGDEARDYVIGTGETHSVGEFCEIAFSHVGLDWREHVVTDPAFFRPPEAQQLVADATRARTELGWSPTVGFHELVRGMVDADLERLRTRP